MSGERVLITHALPAGGGDDIPAEWTVWNGEAPMPRRELLKRVPGLDGLLCMLVDGIDAELIAAGSDLKVISQMSVGVDNVDLVAATAAGIPVGHTPGVLTETTADSAFALLAAAARRLPEGAAVLRAGEVGEWDPEFLMGGDLWDTTIGIVGFGRIGQAVARRAAGFGMRVIYSGPRPKEEALALGAEFVDFEKLVTSADHVVITAPLTEATYHLFDRPVLERMREGATLVNVARGGLIDHDALTEVAGRGFIRVGLDVTEPEPLPADHPLLAMRNVLVVPHLGSASRRTRRAMADLAVANLKAGLDGRRLPACANSDVYADRS